MEQIKTSDHRDGRSAVGFEVCLNPGEEADVGTGGGTERRFLSRLNGFRAAVKERGGPL